MLTLGHYLPSETPLHHLDPRVKIAATLLLSLVIFRADGPQIILISAFFAFLIGAAGIPVRHIGRALRPVAPFMALLFGMQLLVVGGNSPGSLSPLPIAISSEGGRQGAYVVWQFAGLVISGALLTMTTSSFDIVQGIERLLRPASRVGVPSSGIAMMIAMAMRFFPLLTEEYERIRMAQLSRGADSGSGSLIRRFRAAANLTLPLLLAAFRRADALILAMEARGYHRGPRTSLTELRLTAKDGIALTVMSVLILADIGLGMLPPPG